MIAEQPERLGRAYAELAWLERWVQQEHQQATQRAADQLHAAGRVGYGVAQPRLARAQRRVRALNDVRERFARLADLLYGL